MWTWDEENSDFENKSWEIWCWCLVHHVHMSIGLEKQWGTYSLWLIKHDITGHHTWPDGTPSARDASPWLGPTLAKTLLKVVLIIYHLQASYSSLCHLLFILGLIFCLLVPWSKPLCLVHTCFINLDPLLDLIYRRRPFWCTRHQHTHKPRGMLHYTHKL